MTRRIEDVLQQAVSLHQRNDLVGAKALYESALQVAPGQQDALHLLGVLHAQRQEYNRSIELIDRAIAVDPTVAAFHANKGIALMGLTQLAGAVTCFDRALELNPNFPDALNNKGNALRDIGKLEEAERCYREALAIDNNHFQATLNLSQHLYLQNRWTDVLPYLHTLVRLQPDSMAHRFKLANALAETGQLELAVREYEVILERQPTDFDTLNNFGAVLVQLNDRIDDARAALTKALSFDPDNPGALNNRALCRWALDDVEGAKSDVQRALTSNPYWVDALITKGHCAQSEEQYASAIECYDTALKIDPTNAHAQWNKSLVLLLIGNYELGWELYEWGFRCGQRGGDRGFLKPRWQGEPLRGKTILIHHEQGYGDTIQFCRFVALVAARGGKAILEAPRPLIPILKSLVGPDSIVALGDPLPSFDVYSPLLSLPKVLGTTIKTIPAPQKYLSTDPMRIMKWEKRLGQKKSPRIGIAWSGSKVNPNDRRRNIPLRKLLSWLPNDHEIISLQTEVRDNDRPCLESSNVRFFGNELTDFGDTAALCELCDRVISVDTSVVHLNAALGRPTSVLLPRTPPDWRWLLERQDSPWYPTVRVFRGAECG